MMPSTSDPEGGARSVRVGAYAVCRREDSILLVHQIAPGPAEGMWTLPGGGVEFGEDPRAAVAREVREETGCAVELGALFDVHSGVVDVTGGAGAQHVVRLLFSGDLVGTPITAQPDEVDAIQWHLCADLPENTTVWARTGALGER